MMLVVHTERYFGYWPSNFEIRKRSNPNIAEHKSDVIDVLRTNDRCFNSVFVAIHDT